MSAQAVVGEPVCRAKLTFVEVQGGALRGKKSADVFDAPGRAVRRDQQLSEPLLDSCGQRLWRQVLDQANSS